MCERARQAGRGESFTQAREHEETPAITVGICIDQREAIEKLHRTGCELRLDRDELEAMAVAKQRAAGEMHRIGTDAMDRAVERSLWLQAGWQRVIG